MKCFFHFMQQLFLQYSYFLFQYFESFLCYTQDSIYLPIKNLFHNFFLVYYCLFSWSVYSHISEKKVSSFKMKLGEKFLIFLQRVLPTKSLKNFHGLYLHFWSFFSSIKPYLWSLLHFVLGYIVKLYQNFLQVGNIQNLLNKIEEIQIHQEKMYITKYFFHLLESQNFVSWVQISSTLNLYNLQDDGCQLWYHL